MQRTSRPFPTFRQWLPEASPNLTWEWDYLQLIGAELERLDEPDTPDNLMIFCPPRVGKSTMVTVRHPLYCLERNPSEEVMVISYKQDLADKFSRQTRRLAHGRIEFNRERKAVRNWETAQGGSYRAAGISSGVTGEGATRIYIDDPIKGRDQADSLVWREKVWEAWTDDIATRRNPGCKVVLILTRWHADDLAGRILASRDAANWRVVSLPMVAEEDTYYELTDWERKKGDLLNPARYPAKVVERIQQGPERTYQSLYQQRPTRKGGQIFREQWFNYYYTVPTHFDEIIQSWDMAFKAGESTSFVVGHVWGRYLQDAYLLRRVSKRMDIVESMQAVALLTAAEPRARLKLVEAKANGPAIVRLLKKRISGLIEQPVEGSKEQRAISTVPFAQSGNIYLPHPAIAPWIIEVVEQLKAFPLGTDDDDVDAFTQAINYLLGKSHTVAEAQAIARKIREFSGDDLEGSAPSGRGWLDSDPIDVGRYLR